MNTSKHRWRLIATATAVGAVVGFAAAIPATAAPVILPTETEGDLHIIKQIGPDTGNNADGTTTSNPGQTPIAGVEFTIWQVTHDGNVIDLSTNEGWQLAAQLATALGPNPFTGVTTYADALDIIDDVTDFGLVVEGSGIADATGLNGEALFADIDLGVYLVIETDAPAIVQTPADPFLVTVPITDPATGDDWLYDVYVYPKNEVETATKTVTDASANVGITGAATEGEAITYTVTYLIPDLTPLTDGEPDVLTFTVEDTLPSQLAQIIETDVVVTVDGNTLVNDTDYTLDVSGNVVDLEFDASGITAINAADPLDPIVITITAVVDTQGEFTNTATGTFNFGEPDETELPATSGLTKWGKLTLTKWWDSDGDANGASEGGNDLIEDAEFKLYFSEADALAGTNAYQDDGANDTVFSTDALGVLEILFRYNAWENEDTAVTPASYWLVETKTGSDPIGTEFELLTDPIEVTVDSTTETLSVQNVEKLAGFLLPLTGGAGTAIFYTLGGAAIALTVVLFVVFGARRRKEHEEI